MATTENTLPHDTYANQTTALWATAQAGQQFVSPSEVVNQAIPPTAELTTIVTTDVPPTGSFQLNTIPNGTPLNEIEFAGATNGIALKTNGEYTLVTAPNETAVLGDLIITSKQTGGTWIYNNNELSYNNYKQLTGDATYSQLGSNSYSDSFGLNVWNTSSFNNTSTINDTNLSFYTSTGGTSNNLTYSFVSELVPFTSTGNPDQRTANARTPIFPNDVDFYGYNAQSTISTVSGGSGVPYTINISNSGGTSAGIGARMTQLNGDTFRSSQLPFWFEVTMFDPGSVIYELDELGGLFGGTGELMKDIKNVAGALTFIPLGFSTPQSFIVGDKMKFIFEYSDPAKTLLRVLVSKNNVALSITNSTIVGNIRQFSPNFFTTTAVVSGFNYNLVFNFGNTSSLITSFNEWEWTAGKGGLYGYNNTAIRPAASGSAPNPATFYSIVYLQDGGEFISPPIPTQLGITYTISAFFGSRLGTGSLVLTQNGNNIGSPTVPNPAWTQGTLATFIGTGSDNLRFIFTGSAGDFCSLQRINLAFNDAVDTLIGGIGKSGTSIVMGASSNFVASPDIQMTSSNISVNKSINMNNNTISNTTFSGNIQTNSITPISPATSTSIGNFDLNTNTLSRGTLRPFNIGNSGPASNVVMLCPLDMSNNNILQANIINSVDISNQGLIETFNLRTPTLDAVNGASNITIGSNSFHVNLSNVNILYGRGQFAPMIITMLDTINQVSACATGGIYIQTNFDGFKTVMIPLIPTWNRSDTVCYQLGAPNYTGTEGYLLVGKSELVIFDQFLTVLSVHTNNLDVPRSFFNTDLILNTPNRLYTYRPYLAGL